MSCFRGRVRLLGFGCIVILGLASCSRLEQTNEQAQVLQSFKAWKNALINHQTDHAMAYVPHHVDDYLAMLNTGAPASISNGDVSASASPGVDLLLRTALQKKVPPDLRSKLTLSALIQRIMERNLFNPRDVRQIELGPVTLDGNRAYAEVYYQGTLTAMRLPFIKEGDTWKIDVMALLPYAEVLMRVDRAIKGETEKQQVDQLVSKLPSL